MAPFSFVHLNRIIYRTLQSLTDCQRLLKTSKSNLVRLLEMGAHRNTNVCGQRIVVVSWLRANSNFSLSSLEKRRKDGSMLLLTQSTQIGFSFTRASFTPSRSQNEQIARLSSSYFSEYKISSDDRISNVLVYSDVFL
jgi:hypothetical protein